jgi:hypothetical protein
LGGKDDEVEEHAIHHDTEATQTPPAAHHDPDVQKIIAAGRAGDKTGANKLFLDLRKKRKWSDDENEKMVAHIMGKIKDPAEEEPEDNPLALSQSTVSLSVREQVLKDLQAEVLRLYPLSSYGA